MGAWSFVLGAKPTKASPRGDGTAPPMNTAVAAHGAGLSIRWVLATILSHPNWRCSANII